MLAGVPDALANTDHVAAGLDKSPLAYFTALLVGAVVVLFAMLLRVQSLRAAELKEGAERAEKLGGIIEKHNQAMAVLERAVAFVMAQQPRKRAVPAELGAEPATGKGRP